MITIDLDDAELQRLIDALTIACDAYGARGMDVQAIPFELLRDKLEALRSGGDEYGDYDY